MGSHEIELNTDKKDWTDQTLSKESVSNESGKMFPTIIDLMTVWSKLDYLL